MNLGGGESECEAGWLERGKCPSTWLVGWGEGGGVKKVPAGAQKSRKARLEFLLYVGCRMCRVYIVFNKLYLTVLKSLL